MNDQNVQTGQLQENEAVKQFLQLLMENRPDKGQVNISRLESH